MRLTAANSIQPSKLITHRYGISDATNAYRLVVDNPNGEQFVGVVLDYDGSAETPSTKIDLKSSSAPLVSNNGNVRFGLIGAGNFMSGTIAPALLKTEHAEISWVTSASGLSAADLGRKINTPTVGSDYSELISSPTVDAVISATRHNLGAKIATESLLAGKPVHIEKPLALSVEDLQVVANAMQESDAMLMVGFNRRFAPLVENLKQHFESSRTPLSMLYRINAGWIEPDVWVHDPVEGGGRILGEVCHFIDLMQHICNSEPVRVQATRMKPDNKNVLADDNVQVAITFSNGSTGTVIYSALGAPTQPKEYVEVMGGRRSAVLDDFKTLTLYASSVETLKNKYGDKGHKKQFQIFADRIKSGGESPIPPRQLIASTLATLAVLMSLENGRSVSINSNEISLDFGDTPNPSSV